MPVAAKPNGWRWGKLERPPRFFVLCVPNMTVEEAEERFLKPDAVADSGDTLIYARRKRVVKEALVQQALNAVGRVTTDDHLAATEAFPRDPAKRPARRERDSALQPAGARGRHG